MSVEACREALRITAERLAPLLQPIGFHFVPEQAAAGHGSFANGFFVNGDLKIGLICRDQGTLGEVIYENSTSNVSHDELMKFLGLESEQHFRVRWPAAYAADGADPCDALITDLSRVMPTLQDRAAMDRLIEQSLKARRAEWGVNAAAGAAPARPVPSGRGLGHYLLLILVIVFGAEGVIFLGAALQRGMTPAGWRFLALTIVAFLTFAAALYGFIRRIHSAVRLFLGLVVLQLIVSRVLEALR